MSVGFDKPQDSGEAYVGCFEPNTTEALQLTVSGITNIEQPVDVDVPDGDDLTYQWFFRKNSSSNWVYANKGVPSP